jgi:hypothetical protein
MIVLSARNKELEAELVASNEKHKKDQQTLMNRLQESMSTNQQLFVESVEKNAEIRNLKEKLSKCLVQEKPDAIELESKVTDENANNMQQKSLDEKQQGPAFLNQKQPAELNEIDVELESEKRIQSELEKQTIDLSEDNAESVVVVSSSEVDHACNKSSKRAHDTIDLSDESSSESQVKKQRIKISDTVLQSPEELARKVHSALISRSMTYEKFADAHRFKREELAELLDNPTPWHLMDKKKRAQYMYLNSWVKGLSEPEVLEVEDADSLKTENVAKQIVKFLQKCGNVGYVFR